MTPKRIGILGCNGVYGQWLTAFFQKHGHEVVGLDKPHSIAITPLRRSSAMVTLIKGSDVVIFAVPIGKTVSVIRSAVAFARKDQLWLDVTSVKQPAIEAMLESPAEVVGMHPLFAPPKGETWEGGTVAICPARLTVWKPWFQSLMRELKATVRVIDAREHDKLMLHVQNMPHLCALAQAMLVKLFLIEPKKLLIYGTPVSHKQYAVIARILLKSPEVYADIQMQNPDTCVMIDALIRSLERLRSIVTSGNREAFIAEFLSLREHFGDKVLTEMLASSDSSEKR